MLHCIQRHPCHHNKLGRATVQSTQLTSQAASAFAEPQQTYYVIDVMCWQGYVLYDCAAEFRLYWLAAKLAEICLSSTATAQQLYRFMAVPAAPCTPGELCRKDCTAMHRVPCVAACMQTCWLRTQRSQLTVQTPSPPAQTQVAVLV